MAKIPEGFVEVHRPPKLGDFIVTAAALFEVVGEPLTFHRAVFDDVLGFGHVGDLTEVLGVTSPTSASFADIAL